MEEITQFYTQKCRFRVLALDDLDFLLTFNAGGEVFLQSIIEQCKSQLAAAAVQLHGLPLTSIADWLCKALFETYGIGVTVEIWNYDEGATATFGAITVTELEGELEQTDENGRGEHHGANSGES